LYHGFIIVLGFIWTCVRVTSYKEASALLYHIITHLLFIITNYLLSLYFRYGALVHTFVRMILLDVLSCFVDES
jgi:hypothetical protein